MGILSWLFPKKTTIPRDHDDFPQENWKPDFAKKKDLRFPEQDGPFFARFSEKSFHLSLQKTKNFSWLVNPVFQYTDFALKIQGEFTHPQNYGGLVVILRHQTDDNFYYLTLSNTGMVRMDALFNGKPNTIVPWVECPDPKKPFPMELFLRGKEFSIWNGNQWTLEVMDEFFTSGRIGVGLQNFSNLPEFGVRLSSLELESRDLEREMAFQELRKSTAPTQKQRFSLAQSYYSAGKHRETVHQLLKMPKSGLDNPDPGFLLVEALRRSGDIPRARIELDALLEIFPDWESGQLEKAQLLYESSDYLGLRNYLSILLTSRQEPILLNLMGHALHGLGHWSEAGAAYAKAADQDPTQGIYALNAARSYFTSGLIAQGEDYYLKAGNSFIRQGDMTYYQEILEGLRSRAADPKVKSLVGKFFFLEGKEDQARKVFEELENQDQGDSGQWYLLGLILRNKGHQEKALKYFLRAAQEEDYYLFSFRLAETLWMLGQDPEPWAEKAIREGAGDPWVQNFQGQISQDPQFREECFRKANELLPNNPVLRINWSQSLADLERFKEAWKVLEVVAEDSAIWNQKGRLYSQQGDWTKAQTAFRRALEGGPENRDYLENALDAALTLESFSQAEEYLVKLIDLFPNPKYYHRLGVLLIRYGDIPRGEISLKAALELEPGDPSALRELGWLYARRSKFPKVLEILDQWPKDLRDPEFQRLEEFFLKSTSEKISCSSCDQIWWVPKDLPVQGRLRIHGEPPGWAPAGSSPATGKTFCINCAQNHMKGPRFVCPQSGEFLSLQDDRLKYLLKESLRQQDNLDKEK